MPTTGAERRAKAATATPGAKAATEALAAKAATEALVDLAARVDGILGRVEALLPPPPREPDWKTCTAFRWRKRGAHGRLDGRGWLDAVRNPHSIALEHLVGIDEQKKAIDRNTRQFVADLPANNVLLTGSRGTGKSSLVKAMLPRYGRRGLRLIEVDKADLVDLPDIAESVAGRSERFIVFCDDLSFDANEPGYKALKVMLDGTIAAASSNLLIYATSNRRHLLPEFFAENLETKYVGEEVHPGESVEEKISLSERFGLWLSFYPFSQDDYLAAVDEWLAYFGIGRPTGERERQGRQQRAIQWSLQRGSRSGRVAWQFARDYAGAAGLSRASTPRGGVARASNASNSRPAQAVSRASGAPRRSGEAGGR